MDKICSVGIAAHEEVANTQGENLGNKLVPTTKRPDTTRTSLKGLQEARGGNMRRLAYSLEGAPAGVPQALKASPYRRGKVLVNLMVS